MIRKSDTLSLWVNRLAASSVLFFILPFATLTLDQKELNALLVLISISSFQAVFDIGFAGIITRLLGQANENINTLRKSLQIDDISTNKILASSRLIYKRLSLIVFIIFFIIAFISFSINSFFSIQDFFSSKYLSAIIIVILSMSFNVRGKNKVAIMNAYGYLREQNYFRSIFLIIGTISSLILGFITEALLGFISYMLICEAGCFFFNKYWVRKNLPLTIIEYSRYENATTYKYIISASFKTGVGMVIGTFIVQGAGIYSTAVFSLQNSNLFLTCMNYILAIGKFANAPFQSKLPKFNKIFASSNIDKFRRLYIIRLYYVSFLLIALCAITPLFIVNFFTIYDFNYFLWLCMSLMIFSQRLGAINLQIYTVTNDIRWYFSNGITGLVAALFLFFLHPVKDLEAIVFIITSSYLLFYIPYNTFLSSKIIKHEMFKIVPIYIFLYTASIIILHH
jgi:hypothetical protein